MYSLRVEEEGMREPHWHPQTAEMGYVNKGRARMSILDPDGSVDTYTLAPGDMYFIPKAYPHQIEVLDGEDIHFLIFFDMPSPLDIGYRTSATALSREVMAATFGIREGMLPPFPRTVADPLLVKKINPLDPRQMRDCERQKRAGIWLSIERHLALGTLMEAISS
ncbi:hypothetical protein MRB53_037292 [Persea americana]|nr:hypothetical protein MRB53_037292 [Persea americana]